MRSPIWDTNLRSRPGTEKKQQEYNNKEYKGKETKRWAASVAAIVWRVWAALPLSGVSRQQPKDEVKQVVKKGSTVSGQMFHLAQQPPACSTKSWAPPSTSSWPKWASTVKILPPSTLKASNYFLLRFPKQDVVRLFNNPQQITSPSTCPSQLSLNPCRLLTVNHCWQGLPWISYLLQKNTIFFLLKSWLIFLFVIWSVAFYKCS